MMLCRSSADAALVSSDTSDGPPKRRPSAAFPWHFAQFCWNTGFAVRLPSDGDVCAESATGKKTKQQKKKRNLKIFKPNLDRK